MVWQWFLDLRLGGGKQEHKMLYILSYFGFSVFIVLTLNIWDLKLSRVLFQGIYV